MKGKKEIRTHTESVRSVEKLPFKSFKFLIVGGINTAVFYGLYVWLIRNGLHYSLSLAADYAGGIVCGYLVNRYWTFGSHGRPSRGFLKYCATYAAVFILNWLFLAAIVELGLLDPIFGQIAAFGAASALSFLLQNFWVFPARHV
jgi:putative flippase GtrA